MKKILHYTRGYCPIPMEKRNFNLYLKIKNFFLNTFLIFNPFGTLILNFIFLSFILIFFTIFCIFSSYGNMHFLVFETKTLFFSISFTNFIYFLTLQNWRNLKNLTKESITIYEEMGTLDERVWKKPIINLIQDNLLLNYKIKPILQKIRNQWIFFNAVMFFFFNISNIFSEYYLL